MKESRPHESLSGRRVMAAIVFTDAVNSCRGMGVAECETVRKLERDFRAMSVISSKLGGRVVKSTGDGLLLHFPSAFAAVCFAIRSQQHFAYQIGLSPAGSCLQHRIAIHIGDVLISRADVMGEGVNIAARVLGETEPGGICITQLVYDLVRDRLTLHTDCLGSRELKNIRQRVPVYRIFLEPHRRKCAAAAGIAASLVILSQLVRTPLSGKVALSASMASLGLSVATIGGYWPWNSGAVPAPVSNVVEPSAQMGSGITYDLPFQLENHPPINTESDAKNLTPGSPVPLGNEPPRGGEHTPRSRMLKIASSNPPTRGATFAQ